MLHRLLSRLSPRLRFELGYLPADAPHFSAERSLLRGKKISASKRQSVLFFTVHKSASAYTGEMLKFLCEDGGLVPVNFPGFLSLNNIPEGTLDPRQFARYVHPEGYYYGPMRRYWPLPDLDRYKIFLLLRDPRDTLVSMYFSSAYSHVLENPTLEKRRARARNKTIDAYALAGIAKRKTIYETYLRQLMGRPQVLFLKYEDMTTQFPAWLDRIISHLGFAPSPRLKRAILNEATFTVEKEDVYAHKRQVTPGDHRRKLKPETIEVLNREFADILKRLDYPL